MKTLYRKLDEMLNTVDFNAIYTGFRRFDFALYNEETVYFRDKEIPYDNRFLGNTSIEYEGDRIAIWQINDPENEDVTTLAANMVHEMFHAYQNLLGENRYPSDIKMLDYPEDTDNYRLRHIENLRLADAAASRDINAKREALLHFINIRKYRADKCGSGDIIRQEFLTETIEGMAEYAGCRALYLLSPEKYNARISDYIEKIKSTGDLFFDIRRSLYFIGALFFITMREAGFDINSDIGKTDVPAFDIITRRIPDCKRDVFDIINNTDKADDTALTKSIKLNIGTKRDYFNDFLKSHDNRVECDYYICGYDPMNMKKLDNMILCSHFIMLTDNKRSEPLFIRGPVLIFIKPGTDNIVYAYIN